MALPELVHPKRHLAAVTTTAEPSATPKPKRTPAQKRKPAVLYTEHDVERFSKECDQLKAALGHHGVGIDLDVINTSTLSTMAEANGLAHLLVNKGIITQDEMRASVHRSLSLILKSVLMTVEVRHAQAQADLGRVQPVEAPKLLVVRH